MPSLEAVVDAYSSAKFIVEKGVFYHGTSSRFLRSIRKNGLVFSPKSSANRLKKKASRGIYLSNKMTVAVAAAEKAIVKFAGSPLIIACLVNVRNYSNPAIDSAVYHNLYDIFGIDNTPDITTVVRVFLNGLVIRQVLPMRRISTKGVHEYNDYLLQYSTLLPDIHVSRPELIDDLFFAVLSRHVSKIPEATYAKEAVALGFTEVPPYPQIDDAQREFLRAFAAYNRYSSSSLINVPTSSSVTLNTCIPDGICYVGANRILAIGELLTAPIDRVIVHYGKLPISFIKENQERIGHRFKIERLDSSYPVFKAKDEQF